MEYSKRSNSFMSSVGRCVDDGFGSVRVTSTAKGKYPMYTGLGHCCSSVNELSKYLWYFSDIGKFTSAKSAFVFRLCKALARHRRLQHRPAHVATSLRASAAPRSIQDRDFALARKLRTHVRCLNDVGVGWRVFSVLSHLQF